MFKNTFQSGFLSILYSIGSKPLQIWEKEVRNGHIKRITDNDIQSSVLEIMSRLSPGWRRRSQRPACARARAGAAARVSFS